MIKCKPGSWSTEWWLSYLRSDFQSVYPSSSIFLSLSNGFTKGMMYLNPCLHFLSFKKAVLLPRPAHFRSTGRQQHHRSWLCIHMILSHCYLILWDWEDMSTQCVMMEFVENWQAIESTEAYATLATTKSDEVIYIEDIELINKKKP